MRQEHMWDLIQSNTWSVTNVQYMESVHVLLAESKGGGSFGVHNISNAEAPTRYSDVWLFGSYLWPAITQFFAMFCLASWHEFSVTNGSLADWACWIRGGKLVKATSQNDTIYFDVYPDVSSSSTIKLKFVVLSEWFWVHSSYVHSS